MIEARSRQAGGGQTINYLFSRAILFIYPEFKVECAYMRDKEMHMERTEELTYTNKITSLGDSAWKMIRREGVVLCFQCPNVW